MDWIINKLLSKAFLTTVLRNILIAVGGYLVGTGKIDATQWETISGAIVVIFLSLAGGTDSVKDKISFGGKVVDAKKLPVQLQSELASAAEVRKGRGILNIFFGQ